MIVVTEECKELEKKAKELEKNDMVEAIGVYKQASECYSKQDKIKNKNSNLLKVAKLLRELGKSNEDPTIALDYYEESSSIYTEIEKDAEAEKVIQEAYQKFADSAKSIILEARKMDDIEAAEKRFKLASQYAKLGEDEELSNKSWMESGNQFYKAAKVIEDPRVAFEVFKHSIINYNKGKATEKQNLLLNDAAEKFVKKGTEIYKTNKTLVLALDNYVQATTLYQSAKSEQKSKDVDKRIQEICDRIGIPKDPIINYLNLQGIKAVSFDEVIQITEPTVEQIPDIDKSDIGFTEKETEVEPIIVTTTPEVLDEIKSTAPKPQMEEIERPTVEEPVEEQIEEPVFTPPPEVIEKVEASVSPDIVQPEIPEVTPEPRMEEIETPTVEEQIEEPVFTPPSETIEEVEVSESPDIVQPEVHDTIPEPKMDVIGTPTVAELVEEPVFTAPPEVIEEVEASVSPDIVQTEPRDTIPEPRREEIETPTAEEPVEKTVFTPPPEVIEEVEVNISSDVFQPEILEVTPEPQMEENEIQDPLVYGIKKEFESETSPEPKIEKREIPDPLVYGVKKDIKIEDSIMPSQPKGLEKTEGTKGRIVSGLKPMSPISSEIKQDMRQNSFDPSTDQPEVSDLADKTGGSSTLSESIIEILRKQGYVNDDMKTEVELLQVSEYQILSFLVNNHPVPLEQIEEKTDVSSVSLALSNLQADGLIEQTNDYQWTISQKVKNTIN
ncbi:MAG: hypothetical protein HeimC2_31120 [Candidatus Heimdallarchaeota archaeon LC_2]|nr:MAG: hypothetical protein HeimC2_31120 [Candidatus Heimdallarchaeota archaeon LC_2]